MPTLTATLPSHPLHPDQAGLAEMLQRCGLAEVEVFNLAAGVVAVHRGYRF
jgi:demethylmenaquinone methyltransferase/2-methoxy-6-polyprenyl-1,4-benzoquinol methylase